MMGKLLVNPKRCTNVAHVDVRDMQGILQMLTKIAINLRLLPSTPPLSLPLSLSLPLPHSQYLFMLCGY